MKKLLMLLFLFVSAGNLNAKMNYNKKTENFYSTPATSDISPGLYHMIANLFSLYFIENLAKGYSVFAINKFILSRLDQVASDTKSKELLEILKKEQAKVISGNVSFDKAMIQATVSRVKEDLLKNYAVTGSLFG